MQLGRLFHFIMALVVSALLWVIIIRIIMTIVNEDYGKSLVIPALVVGALSFVWVQLVKRLDK